MYFFAPVTVQLLQPRLPEKIMHRFIIEITLMILLTVDFWQISQLNHTTVQKQEICQPFLIKYSLNHSDIIGPGVDLQQMATSAKSPSFQRAPKKMFWILTPLSPLLKNQNKKIKLISVKWLKLVWIHNWVNSQSISLVALVGVDTL